MKILYITAAYTMANNSASVRNNALVKGLISLGHKVDVLCVRLPDRYSSPHLKEGNIIYSDLFSWEKRESLKEKAKSNRALGLLREIYIRYRKVKSFPDESYTWPQKINAKDYGNYDVIISSSDGKTAHFVGLKIKKQFSNVPWIQIWGDPWLEDVNSTFIDKLRIPFYERMLLSKADKIVYVSKPTADLIKSKYKNLSGKIYAIPRSFFYRCEYPVPQEKEYHIVYTGLLNQVYGRSIDGIVNAVDKYNAHHDKHIHLDFYGNIVDEIKQKYQSESVSFYNGVDIIELKRVYAKANALLYISNKRGSTQIPGKLFDYLGTTSLILCLLNDMGDSIAGFIRSIGDKCILVENEGQAIYEQLDDIVRKMDLSYPCCEEYSPEVVAQKLISII